MARRKQSPLEDLFDLVMLLPPWLGVLLAIVFYFALHQLSLIEIPAVSSTSPSDVGRMFRWTLTKQAAGIGQYFFPGVFVLGALISFLKGRRRRTLLTQTQLRGHTSALLDMSWREFEQLVGAAFNSHGYAVRDNGGPGADGGVDLTLTRNTEIFLVQCKQWRAQQVGVAIVRELYGVMAAKGATGGFVVSSGSFSPDAIEFAKGRNIELIGGEGLLAFIGERAIGKKTAAQPLGPITVASPECPTCGMAMVKRVAWRGKSAGNAFWGCAAYPKCRGTRPW